MRVFAGGCFQNKDGLIFPSLGTCDTIKSNKVIMINDNKFTWKEILDTQMSSWEVNYQEGESFMETKNKLQ